MAFLLDRSGKAGKAGIEDERIEEVDVVHNQDVPPPRLEVFAAVEPKPLSSASQQLVGAWKLIAIDERGADGIRVVPLDYGPDASGLLMYDVGGRMSVRAMRRADDPSQPIGPRWLPEVGRDLTALGGVAGSPDGLVTMMAMGSVE